MVKSCFFVRVIEDLVFQFFDIYIYIHTYIHIYIYIHIFILLIRGFFIWVSSFCVLKYTHTNS